VFDASSSMSLGSGVGSAATKLEAALEAGRTFVDAIVLPGDQAAIVSFHERAQTVQPLTGSRSELYDALDSVRHGEGSRIDLGIRAAAVELLSERAIPVNNPVVIVLTDGRATPGYEDETVEEAAVARSFGATLFAIGLGIDADMELLRTIAGNESQAYFAPDASALESIYRRIAGQVLCE
jgi:Mg-chelatase subunit ChlD